MHAQHFLIKDGERSIYDSSHFDIGRFLAEPTNYERPLHSSDIFAYRSAHNKKKAKKGPARTLARVGFKMIYFKLKTGVS